MLRFPVKKIRKQFKLLLLLVLLTSAVWFTYLHINQGKTIKLHFNYGKGMGFLKEKRCRFISRITLSSCLKRILVFYPDGYELRVPGGS